jgi:hypothetical protein
MQPVDCARCGTRVLVSKNSAAQTSIQWNDDNSSCPVRPELAVGDTCPFLSDTIRDLVLAGKIEVAFSDL